METAVFQHNSVLPDKGNLGSGDIPDDKLQVHHLVL
ncbi:hypothetical protein predicted by Glimmer/Critica [Acetobacter senegalensis]|uniref:Uncharacterized protein n=1 Tax=Acetobacter senegalensis TaxID=446692 RepID=A0A0U5B6V3_9PROT|nr:hypothetical protein predicted by Glimmer/Critica [Acetobacter senegalensis]